LDILMIVTFLHVCPAPRCQSRNDVYIEEAGPAPPAEGLFAYDCPTCREIIVVRPGAFLRRDAAPPGAIVARRVPTG
jgi:hypothetical protein